MKSGEMIENGETNVPVSEAERKRQKGVTTVEYAVMLVNRNNSKKQEGFVLVVVAIVLIALVGFLALAVDVGVLYSARTSAQEVADAAALAGAFTFINDTQSPQPQTASSDALQVALHNSILGQPVAAGDVNVNVDVPNRRVTVDVQATQNTYFFPGLGGQTTNVRGEAVAEAAPDSPGTAHSTTRCI